MRCPRCAFAHGGPCPPPDLVTKARDYIAATEADTALSRDPRDEGGFLFAVTMADNPHWYCVRQKAQSRGPVRAEGHEALFHLIKRHHFKRRWGGRPWRAIDLDGYAYWIIQDGTVINRKPSEAAGWDDDGQGSLF